MISSLQILIDLPWFYHLIMLIQYRIILNKKILQLLSHSIIPEIEIIVQFIHRGEIYFADLSHAFGSEQSGLRPVVIIQNDYGNRYSPTTIIAPITTKRKGRMPTHVDHWHHRTCETVLLEQVRAISCTRLVSRVGQMSRFDMDKIDDALRVSLGLASFEKKT